jgi:hypothetical protein
VVVVVVVVKARAQAAARQSLGAGDLCGNENEQCKTWEHRSVNVLAHETLSKLQGKFRHSMQPS